jgi:hypothetical protein
MTTPLIAAKDGIVTCLEAVTPLTDATIPYRYLSTSRSVPDGASAHRKFWMAVKDGGGVMHMAAASEIYRHTIDVNVYLTSTAHGLDGYFEFLAQEAILLQRAINKQSLSFGTGVDMVHCPKYSFQPTDGDDMVLTLTCTVQTIEVD